MLNGLQVVLKFTRNVLYFKRLYHVAPRCVWNLPAQPELDLDYWLNENNMEEILNNNSLRKVVANLNIVKDLKKKLDSLDASSEYYDKVAEEFYKQVLKFPNKTHPDVINLEKEPRVVKFIGEKAAFNFKPREFDMISKRLNMVRTEQLGIVCGNRSYSLLGDMVELEQALIKYTISRLLKKQFTLISVPDIIHRGIIEGCGVATKGARTMVYTLDPKMHDPDLCLSGTSEMALAGHFINKTVSKEQLPLKLASVSRCFRAEISNTAEERGIYRVHQFTKVEMFALSEPHKSDQLLEELREIEEENFGALGLHLRTLDMPPHELGPPAYRKYDVEAWLPGRNAFGEISSCSNCTDYQSRRLNIKYETDGQVRHVHTLNGTACAVPRMLIALIETFQTDKGIIHIPEVLQRYMNGKTHIGKQKGIPPLKMTKNKKAERAAI